MLGVSRWGPRGPRGEPDRQLGALADDGEGTAPTGSGDPMGGLGVDGLEDVGLAEVGAITPAAVEAEAEADAWALLASVEGLGPRSLLRLVGRFGSAQAVIGLAVAPGGPEHLAAVLGRQSGILPEVTNGIAVVARDAATRLARLRSLGVTVLPVVAPAFPPRLREIPDPPATLFVRGSLSVLDGQRPAVAVVGTRRPSEEGRLLAGQIAGALARAGAVVVSGLAVGVDGAAHAAVLAEEGATIGVLPGGHGRLFPAAHRRLAEAMVAGGGALVSEFPPDVDARPGLFARRNRLISGLADAVVVVEAPRGSGALLTASYALEQGRECFVVAGPPWAAGTAGGLDLLRSYPGLVRVVAGVAELLDDLGLTGQQETSAGPAAAPAAGRSVVAALGGLEAEVAAALLAGSHTVDALVQATRAPVGAVLGALTLLEDRGLVTEVYGIYRPSGRLATALPRGP